jgi:hypothetical protein
MAEKAKYKRAYAGSISATKDSRTWDAPTSRDTARADVQEFLDGFARALTSGDGAAIAKMWGYPALVIADHDVRAITNENEVAEFFGGAKEQYNARGIIDTHADIQTLDWITERIALVDVRWPHLDATDRELGSESSTYTLRVDDDGELKLCVALMHGE